MDEAEDASHLPYKKGFASVTPGVMHACGHDGHAAIGIGATLLAGCAMSCNGTVKLIFQPAEEGVRGAKSIVDAGHLDGVDYALAATSCPPEGGWLVDIGVLKRRAQGGLPRRSWTSRSPAFLPMPGLPGRRGGMRCFRRGDGCAEPARHSPLR